MVEHRSSCCTSWNEAISVKLFLLEIIPKSRPQRKETSSTVDQDLVIQIQDVPRQTGKIDFNFQSNYSHVRAVI